MMLLDELEGKALDAESMLANAVSILVEISEKACAHAGDSRDDLENLFDDAITSGADARNIAGDIYKFLEELNNP